ncbi:MAG: fumarylacetoacetate hydrolase family protein, partial [Xanthobacteraceae bacterium]
MKLATFQHRDDAEPHVGLAVPGGLLDLTAALGAPSLKALLAHDLGRARALSAQPPDPAKHRIVALDAVTFLPPIPDPNMFFCVGKNYRHHLTELVKTQLIREIPEEPTGFLKLNSVLVGHGAAVARPDGIVQFDYEPELAFVIGKAGYRIARERAMEHVVGITAFNDLTAREIQKREAKSGTKFWTAKNMPGFGPVGPYVVTMDEIADVNDVWMACTVNGELRSRFNTRDQIYKIPDIIEHFSRYMPLNVGDVFATGSAGGV